MKASVSSRIVSLAVSLPVAAFALWWYSRPFIWLGVAMALASGGFTYLVLSTRRIGLLRRALYIGLFLIALGSVVVIVASMGTGTFMAWVGDHQKEYYLTGQNIGTMAFPCTIVMPQLFLGQALFLKGFGIWQTKFPSTLSEFLVLMIPFAATVLIFGRSFCGWICPFGGLNEAMVTGNKQRWGFKALKNWGGTSGGPHYGGLKGWVGDVKYGVLLASLLLSTFLAFPIVCLLCPVLWLSAIPIFWGVIGLIIIFSIVLPFMTKGRWWCQICPAGAFFALTDKISLFRVNIDRKKCDRCYDCVPECRMYALVPGKVEKEGRPNEDCIRCGRCIETCPEGAVDIYFWKTKLKVRNILIPLAVMAALGWYSWMVIILVDKAGQMLG